MKSRVNGGKYRETADVSACIRVSTECRSVCLKTSAYVALCRVCADAMMRGSDLHPILCGACAEACACCAAACEDAAGDPQIDECCDLCLQCFDVCSMMTAEVV
jgi:hypothetical protein